MKMIEKLPKLESFKQDMKYDFSVLGTLYRFERNQVDLNKLRLKYISKLEFKNDLIAIEIRFDHIAALLQIYKFTSQLFGMQGVLWFKSHSASQVSVELLNDQFIALNKSIWTIISKMYVVYTVFHYFWMFKHQNPPSKRVSDMPTNATAFKMSWNTVIIVQTHQSYLLPHFEAYTHAILKRCQGTVHLMQASMMSRCECTKFMCALFDNHCLPPTFFQRYHFQVFVKL